MSGAPTARRLRSATDLGDVDRLYREVFDVDGTGLNVRLLTAIADNGGAVLGVHDAGRLVAFGVSLLARSSGIGLHHYSQTVGVTPDRAGEGLGRIVKHAQRDAALTDGLTTLRWVFDPLQARNAHFNLDVLGGRTRELRRDYYGGAGTGLDAGDPTDRCVVQWDLRDDVAAAPDVGTVDADVRPGDVLHGGEHTLVALPASWRDLRTSLPPAEVTTLRERVVGALEDGFADGRTAVSCVRVRPDLAVYVLEPERSPA